MSILSSSRSASDTELPVLSSACSSLFGFQKLHEDGARTKALLMKVVNLTGCILQPSSTRVYGTLLNLSLVVHGGEFAFKWQASLSGPLATETKAS